ncbi:hypothetical protein D3C86_1510170 [compost metagenome]
MAAPLYLRQNLPAIQPRHGDIRQHDIWFQGAMKFQRHLAVTGMHGAETFAGKIGFENAGDLHVVFSDQN